MRTLLGLLALLVAGCVLGADGLVPDTSIPLDGVAGRIDHLTVDPTRGYLAVAEIGNDSVDIVSLEMGAVIHRITGLDEPQGIAYVESTDLIVVANGGDGSLRFYAGEDFAEAGRLDLGGDADNVHVIRDSARVLVGYGSGALAVVDTQARRVVSRVPLPGHPEGFRLAPDNVHAFVNVPDARQVAVVDIAAGKQVDSWMFPGLASNFPMAIDRSGTQLAIVFRNPPRLGLIDPADGALRSSEDTCRDADDVFFDERRGRIYVSCGAGVVDVFERAGSGYRELGRVTTRTGARTALFVPELDRLFVAARAPRLGRNAELLVLRPAD